MSRTINPEVFNKVLFILRVPPPYGGGEIVSQELYLQLKDKYDFLLIKQEGHSKSKQANPDSESVLRGISFIGSSVYSIIKVRPKIIFIGLSKGIGSFLRNSVVILFSRIVRVKVYGELHGMNFPFLHNFFLRNYFHFVVKNVEKIRVLGQSIKEYLIENGVNKKIYVIPNGISIPNVNKVSGRLDLRKISFLYLGGISKKKGFGRVIETFARLNENDYTNWQLNVIGEWINESEKNSFLKFIKQNKLQDNIYFWGRKIDIEKWDLMAQNNFLIHLTEFDGQPLTILETMGLGIPAISTRIGAIPETIIHEKTGFLVNNTLEAYNVIKKILSNKIDYELMSYLCRENYRMNFTAEKMAENIEKMIAD